MADTLTLRFDGGTLLLAGAPAEILTRLPGVALDPRTGSYRAEARWYRLIVELLRREKIAYTDEARQYQPAAWKLQTDREPFPHQREALATWWQAGGRGVVVL